MRHLCLHIFAVKFCVSLPFLDDVMESDYRRLVPLLEMFILRECFGLSFTESLLYINASNISYDTNKKLIVQIVVLI